MQFLLVPQNGAAKFREWEKDFEDLFAWIESLEPPKYPFAIDQPLAAQGQKTFEQNCSHCHGTYGENASYPNKLVPIEEVGTDRVRLDSLTPLQRAGYEISWFGQQDEKKVIPDPGGYVAPPLDGIWASAPYLHNGSVPTLWHLFHADRAPDRLATHGGWLRHREGRPGSHHDERTSRRRDRLEAETPLLRHPAVRQEHSGTHVPGTARRIREAGGHGVSEDAVSGGSVASSPERASWTAWRSDAQCASEPSPVTYTNHRKS